MPVKFIEGIEIIEKDNQIKYIEKLSAKLEQEINNFEESIVKEGGEIIKIFSLKNFCMEASFDFYGEIYPCRINYHNFLIHYKLGAKV